MKADVPKTYETICGDLRDEFIDLENLACVMEQCLGGDISRAPENGRVTVTGDEARAISWVAIRLMSEMRRIADALNENYAAAQRNQANSPV